MKKLLLLLGLLMAALRPVPAYAGCQDRPGSFKLVFEALDQALPTVAADISTKTTILDVLTLTNTTAGALTVTIKDKQSSAKDFLTAVSIAANTTYVITFGEAGKKFSGGINWVASGSGINGYLYGCKAP